MPSEGTMILVTGGEKGGTGKTMLATNLAVCFAREGKRVKLIDADSQGSSARWATKRAALEQASLPFIPWSMLRDSVYFAVREESRHYDVVLVDAGGADTEEFETALAAADCLITPVMPSDCDIATLEHIESLAARIVGSGRPLKSHVVLNHVSNHVANEEADEARAVLADFRSLRVADSLIHTRKSFRDAFKARLSVVECADTLDRRARLSHAKAAEEVWAIYKEVMGNV